MTPTAISPVERDHARKQGAMPMSAALKRRELIGGDVKKVVGSERIHKNLITTSQEDDATQSP